MNATKHGTGGRKKVKIKSIHIEGMHNVSNKTYNLKDVTYFVGKNGAGKSTVLQAIQLGLLGYIPNSAKTNEGIFRHAQGKTMSVTLTLDDNGHEVVVTRSWVSAGSTVKSAVNIQPDGYNLTNIFEGLELPIFNFSDFLGLTANKMKEWFISFLPAQDSEIDWEKELTTCLSDKQVIDKELVPSTISEIKNYSETGLELIKRANTYFKEYQTYLKGRISALQGTIDSLTYYDDFDTTLDEDSVRETINNLNALRRDLLTYQANEASVQKLKAELASYSELAESYSSDVNVHKLEKDAIDEDAKRDDLVSQIAKLEDELRAKIEAASEIRAEIKSYSTLLSSSGICPYTSTKCESVEKAAQDANDKVTDLKEALVTAEAECAEMSSKINDMKNRSAESSRKAQEIRRHLIDMEMKYSRRDSLKSQLAATCSMYKPTEKSDQDILNEINSLSECLAKIEANKRYNEFNNKVTSEKFMLENSLEVVKIWAKHTDANGMQTSAMEAPFKSLEDDMSKYLTQMFNNETTAHFNLSEKANSFSFGLIRDDKYILYDTLSSGEKCLYTLALMMCLTNRAECPLKLVIVDDLLDHLDDDNAEYLFNSLAKLKDIQIILAGVQKCKVTEVMEEV